MNFEDFARAWRCQKSVGKATISGPEALLREIRLEQRLARRTNLFADLFVVGVDAILIPFFLYHGIRYHDWAFYLMAFVCLFVSVFILMDRWRQRRRQPSTNDTLISCVQSLLIQVRHEIWRSKNIFWWYVLPLEIGFTGVAVSWCGRLFAQVRESEIIIKMAGWAAWVLFCVLLGWSVCWLNRITRRKSLEPRRIELEALLASLNENSSTAGEPPPKKDSNMKTLLLILLLLLAISTLVVIAVRAAASAAADKPRDSEAVRKKDGVPALRPSPVADIEAVYKQHNVPALAVIATKDGEICDRAAVGVRKHGDPTPITTNDVVHIGSCTKSMTATLAAMFIEEGKLRWDTTIAEVFPELQGKMDKRYEAVTLEQLLHHRGGVPGEPPSAAWKRAWQEIGTPTEQRREFVESVLSVPPRARPGTEKIYSNQGYAIVGAMLEKISGQGFESLMTEKLFKPLAMNTAGFGPPGTKDKVDQPWGHVRRLFQTSPLQVDNPPVLSPAGRVHCSLDDLARYAMFHLQRGTNGLLKPETMARLHAVPEGVEIKSVMDNYACGWVRMKRGWAGGPVLWHNGSNTMWYMVMWLAPEKNFCVIAVTNMAGEDAEKACDDACVVMIQKWLPEK